MTTKFLPVLTLLLFLSCNGAEEKPATADSVAAKKDQAAAPDTDELNYTDANGLRQGHWIITETMQQDNRYSPGAKVEEGTYKDGKREGVWKSYFPNGNLKTEGMFTEDRLIGEWKVYDEKGNRVFKNGA